MWPINKSVFIAFEMNEKTTFERGNSFEVAQNEQRKMLTNLNIFCFKTRIRVCAHTHTLSKHYEYHFNETKRGKRRDHREDEWRVYKRWQIQWTLLTN